jgi:hypothetical protein
MVQKVIPQTLPTQIIALQLTTLHSDLGTHEPLYISSSTNLQTKLQIDITN